MEPLFTAITQVSVIVPDAKAYARRYNDLYGIGPWTFSDFTAETTTEMKVDGQPTPYSMRLALCDCLNVQLELIEPFDELSVYAAFLREHGPGIHHIAVAMRDGYGKTIATLGELGHPVVQSGRDSGGMDFAYVDIMKDLGIVVELCNPPPDFVPPAADFTYP